MIIFKNFSIEDNEKYLSYLKKCSQIPSDASPIIFLNLKKIYEIYRCYENNFCWHKLIFRGEEFFLMPLGDWENANLKKFFGNGIEFEELGDYSDYILDLEKIYKIQGQKLKHFRNEKNFFEKHF